MKTKLLTISLVFVGFNSLAQITVTDTDILDIGDVIYEALDSVSGSAIQIGASGANQTWDFSYLQQNEVNIIEHVDPNSTPFGSTHPTSNICAIDDNQNLYINKSSTGAEMVGIDDVQFLNPVTILPLPLTYPMQHSTGAILTMDDVIENPSFLPDSLAPLMTFGQAHTIDSINLQITLEFSYNVDGWGDVIIPLGTFSALRLYVSSIRTQTVSVYCTDTISGTNSGWYPAPQYTGIETDYFYQWWSNDPAVKFTLVNIDVDEFGDNYGRVQFLTNNATSVDEKDDLAISVFPVPATDYITIKLLNNNQVSVQLSDMSGKVIMKTSLQNTTQLNMSSYSAGIYYLTLKSEGRSLVKKIIIK